MICLQEILEVILIVTAFLSIIPVISMFRNREDYKYACLKYLIYASFLWSILILVERISTSAFLVYYAGMLGYPLKLIFASLMLCTIFQYVERKFPKLIIWTLGVLIVADLIVALTNSNTMWFLELKLSQLTTFNDLYISNNGPLFLFHLILSYAVALTAIILLFVFLAKQRGIRQYREVTRMMVISVLVVLIFNLLQLVVFDININLTYISLIFVAYTLYDVIYRKDMVFNLRSSGRGEILSNMREMYILTDKDKRIIEISPMLLEKYHLSPNQVISQPFDSVVEQMSDRVVLYSEHNVDEETDPKKDHYHLREKDFKLRGMNDYGHMILLYDETQVYNLLRELNHLSNFDSMTGLHNRNYIENKLKGFISTKNTGVLSLDLNGLKINNDYLGHERGDTLLKSLSEKMREVYQDVPNKEMARIGGDEFIIIVKDTSLDLMEKKKEILLSACMNDQIDQLISVSVGLAFDSEGNNNIYGLIQHADAQMYDMKAITSKQYKKELIEYIKLQEKFIR